ncbi:hypothetical protein K469DRAFT_695946 [Zopfia rhizophila CBS 207.26]|uniref:Uncharacterized protein n=1 Tax=Zopfia rhizophila CBS 207.26 TaxID=1314779 RepID=A0A6A6EIE8_9PEZI|nr:hypothetical protein K469DRAFT_695946 [Zopfia rhizophila CBS 207.26]
MAFYYPSSMFPVRSTRYLYEIFTISDRYPTKRAVMSSRFCTNIEFPMSRTVMYAVHPIPYRYLRDLDYNELQYLNKVLVDNLYNIDAVDPALCKRIHDTLDKKDDVLECDHGVPRTSGYTGTRGDGNKYSGRQSAPDTRESPRGPKGAEPGPRNAYSVPGRRYGDLQSDRGSRAGNAKYRFGNSGQPEAQLEEPDSDQGDDDINDPAAQSRRPTRDRDLEVEEVDEDTPARGWRNAGDN